MRPTSSSPSVAALVATACVALLFVVAETEAKRGCSAFGHSCYGGMGKRVADSGPFNEELMQEIPQDKNGNHFSDPVKNIFVRSENPDLTLLQQYRYMSPFLRQMLQVYKKYQLGENSEA